jgi:hypothetical protein
MPSSRRVRKRTVVDDEHNDEEQKQDDDHDNDEDSSPSPPKIARLDQNHDNHDHANESNDPVEEEEEVGEPSDMDNDDEEEEQVAPRRINLSGKPAETGIIKKICVENFMCHRKLTVELCPNGTRLLYTVLCVCSECSHNLIIHRIRTHSNQ